MAFMKGRDSVVSMASRYDLSNPGGRRDFPHLSRPALWPIQPPKQLGSMYFQGVKRPGAPSLKKE